jgi:hypothetical protein
MYSSCVPSSFIHSFHILLPLFFSFLFGSNLPFPHYVLFVFTVLNDAQKWEMQVNICNKDLVPANNCVVNYAGEYNEIKNLN